MGSILVVAEIQGGKIREASFELASIAQKLAAAGGHQVKSLVTGKGIAAQAEDFAKKGGGDVYAADHEALANYCVESASRAIRAAVDASGAELVLLSNTPSGWDVAPRIAAGLDAGFVSDCFKIDSEGGKLVFHRRVFNGKLDARISTTQRAGGRDGPARRDVAVRRHAPPERSRRSRRVPRRGARALRGREDRRVEGRRPEQGRHHRLRRPRRGRAGEVPAR